MRHPLHCLLVGVLVFSLSINPARACWHGRQAHRCQPVAVCSPAPACGAAWDSVVVISDVAVSCGWAADPCAGAVVVQASPWTDHRDACGQTVACGYEEVVVGLPVEAPATVLEAPTRAREAEAPGAVADAVSPQTTPAPAAQPYEQVRRPEPIDPSPPAVPPVAEQSVFSVGPVQPVETATPADPSLRPVAPASASEPVEPTAQIVAPAAANPVFPEQPTPEAKEMREEPATVATPEEPTAEPDLPALPPVAPPEPPPAVTAEEPVAPPAADEAKAEMKEGATVEKVAAEPEEPNLFEEVEANPVPGAKPAAEPAEPSLPPDAASDPEASATEPPAAEPAAGDTEEETASQPEPTADETPADETPADEPAAADEAVPEADPFSAAEPARRWIDASGRYAVVGTLVAVTAEAAEIRTLGGRTVRVEFAKLSPHDRAYAEQAGERIVAQSVKAPPTDTAGL